MALTVCCFWWRDPQEANSPRRQYTAQHVIRMRNMMARHLTLPHEFVCVTDEVDDLDGIRKVPMDRSIFLPKTRYAKLMLFRRDAAEIIGKRILYVDIDAVITRNIDKVAGRKEPFVIMHNANFHIPGRTRFNTGLMLLDAGVRPDIYERFHPEKSRQEIRVRQMGGTTDQAWITMHAPKDLPFWDRRHGVYDGMKMGNPPGSTTELPDDARIVVLPGNRQQAMAETQKMFPWIVEHWR